MACRLPPDLAGSRGRANDTAPPGGRDGQGSGARGRPLGPARRGADGGDRAVTERLGRADLHIHTLASDGTAGIAEILEHVERNTRLDVIAITDHERVDAAVAARSMARDGG